MDDINIVSEMNMPKLAIQQQKDHTTDKVPTHGYNLRECPTKWKEQISFERNKYHWQMPKRTKVQEWTKNSNT